MHIAVVISLFVLLGTSFLLLISPIEGASPNNSTLASPLYPPDSKPYGLTFGQWAMNWHKWLYSLPASINPATDTTGKNCGQGQSGPVWFLAGTTGGMAIRTCTVPSGKAILFPIIASECSYSENPNLSTESELASCALGPDNGVTHLELTIDGRSIPDLSKYRAMSPLFSFVFPSDNVAGVKPGPTRGVADGYWAIISPLSAGNHTIHFKAVALQYTTTATATSFVIDTTYNLSIK